MYKSRKKNNMDVSIIVPLYKGEKYIEQITNQIVSCAKVVPEVRVELLFINDYPEQTIQLAQVSSFIDIRIINSKVNRGIHESRVEGLKNTSGEYVLFLDQDDWIDSNYLKSQLMTIKDVDASVCRVITNKRLHYTNTHVFENVVTKDFMLNKWCSIISPGQVLIKRTAIPQIWIENILKNNGADDYFLWLCMMESNKKFALNQDILYEHVFTGENVSEDTNRMIDSENEMLSILESSDLFRDDKICLENLRDSLRKIHIKQLDTQKRALRILNKWYLSYINKTEVYEWMLENQGTKIAIYGAGELGIGLEKFLVSQNLNLLCFIDQNAPYIMSDLPAYTIETMQVFPEVILLTIPNEELKHVLKKRFECVVIDVEKLSEYEL